MAASLIILSGCASIVSKSNYTISVKSEPAGARITVKDKKGVDVYTGNTPASFNLKSGAGFFTKASYQVTFEMDGYASKTVPVYFSFDGWYIGNLVFGGIIGMLIVDPATGVMWKLDTEFINETLLKSTAGITEPSLEFYVYNEIPESWKEKLVRIN